MKYHKVVEAFQITEDDYYCTLDWPNWAKEALDRPINEFGAIWYEGFTESTLYIRGLTSNRKIEVGDYLVRNYLVGSYVADRNFFESNFTPLEE